MEEVTQRSQEYSTAKNMIKGCIKDTKQNFIYIGHYLKEIRDNRLYQEDGYADFDAFMASEIGKDKSWASRCINVADQFGIVENGQPALAEEYQEYSLSLLIEMVAMTPEQRQLVTPDTEVKQAREIKKADKEKSCESQLEEPKEKDAKLEPKEDDVCPPNQSYCARQEWGPEPEQQSAGRKECDKCWADWKKRQKALGQPEPVPDDEPVQTEGYQRPGEQKLFWAPEDNPVQTEEEIVELSACGTPKMVYPPDSYVDTKGCEGGHSCFCCHRECNIRQEECHCIHAPLGNPFPCEILDLFDAHVLDRETDGQCPFVNLDRAYHRTGDCEPVPCCERCETKCEYACSRSTKKESEEQLDEICAGCEMGQYVCDILNEYNNRTGELERAHKAGQEMAGELLREKDKHQWIPVEERLPGEDDNYLCTYTFLVRGNRQCLCHELTYEFDEWYFDGDCQDNICEVDGEVIAWMPLPERYQPSVLAEAGIPAGSYADNPTLAPTI